MIKHPLLILLILISIEAGVLFLASRRRTSKYFDVIPSIFWIYFLPMLASSMKLIDAQSPLYSAATSYLLPVSLFILLMTVDVRAILRLGAKALLMFAAGSAGIVLGSVLSFYLFKGIVGPQFWAGFGALSASWTGGSANMIAVKEALGTPDSVFLPMVVVDTVVPYAWMGLLVIAAGHQEKFDQWIRADRSVLNELKLNVTASRSGQHQGMKLGPTLAILLLGAAGAAAAVYAAGILPQIKNLVSTFAWTVIIVTTLAIFCSFTPVKKFERYGSNKIGYFILYFVLTTIGAKANVAHIGSAGTLIAAGCLIVIIHGIVTLVAARILRVPFFLVAASSQANIGGVASAPMVAELYQKGFASIGLLLAILGNLAGTYIGIIVGQLCRFGP